MRNTLAKAAVAAAIALAVSGVATSCDLPKKSASGDPMATYTTHPTPSDCQPVEGGNGSCVVPFPGVPDCDWLLEAGSDRAQLECDGPRWHGITKLDDSGRWHEARIPRKSFNTGCLGYLTDATVIVVCSDGTEYKS